MQALNNSAGAEQSNPVIRVKDLAKQFKKFQAVQKIDLEVQSGDVFGLLGPNGAGKTTVIRMLLGMITPTGGKAEVFGFDPVTQRAEVLARVSAMVEAPALYPTLTASDNLKAIALAAGLNPGEKKLDEALEKMNLMGRAKDKFGTFSLGMKQRLCIAAALLTDPQLIILDEPTNGLDPAGMAEIRQLIKELAAQGRTVFLSSHLLNEVQQVCNRVAIIQNGKIVVQGLVDELLSGKNAIHVRVKQADWEKARFTLQQGWGRAVRASGEYLILERPTSEGGAINEALAKNGIYASEISPRSQSLEEYYLELTGERLQTA
jgi:ABC-2 type transport system ATP-binding protein